MQPDCVVDTTCVTGENPLWHTDHEVLYWCDIPLGTLYRYDPATEAHRIVYDAEHMIGGFTIQADGALLLFGEEGRIARWEDGRTETIVSGIPEEANSRFNDVVADPEGRVFAGTMPTDDRLGRLYRIDTDGSYHVVDDGFDIPNGLGFTGDLETLLVTESEAHTIYEYDYDRATGDLSNRRVFISSPDEPGVPDGMTIDAGGDIWSARWNGNTLYRYSADGELLDTVEFPVRKVASVTFGGNDHRDIYLTTAGGDQRASDGELAGSLFRLGADVAGREEFRSRIDC